LLTEGCPVEALFAEAQRESFSGRLIVERFTAGLQISTESVVYRGRVHTVGFADRNYEKLADFTPSIIENGGFVPSVCSLSQIAAIDELIIACARALQVENGIIKGDIVIGPEGPAVIEVALRLSGGDFSESLIPIGTGVDIVGAAILMAMGRSLDPADLLPTRNHSVINQYFFPPPGRLLAVTGLEKVRAFPWVRKLSIWRQPGELLPAIQCHADRAGVFIVEAPTRKEAEARARLVNEAVQFLVEPVA
jgi:biotin carboxylase